MSCHHFLKMTLFISAMRNYSHQRLFLERLPRSLCKTDTYERWTKVLRRLVGRKDWEMSLRRSWTGTKHSKLAMAQTGIWTCHPQKQLHQGTRDLHPPKNNAKIKCTQLAQVIIWLFLNAFILFLMLLLIVSRKTKR